MRKFLELKEQREVAFIQYDHLLKNRIVYSIINGKMNIWFHVVHTESVTVKDRSKNVNSKLQKYYFIVTSHFAIQNITKNNGLII